MILQISLSALSAAFSLGLADAEEPDWSDARACFEEQAACSDGNCRPEILVNQCRFDALDEQAVTIIRAELRSISENRQSSSSEQSCADELMSEFDLAVADIAQNGPLALAEPYSLTPGANELSTPHESALFWRAQIEERMTGLAGDRMSRGEASTCNYSPLAGVVLMRAQNLAFAESLDALALAEAGDLSAPALWGAWFIYLHADLWQAEQAKAAPVFDTLSREGRFSSVSAENLDGRVARHQPLYAADALSGGWPN